MPVGSGSLGDPGNLVQSNGTNPRWSSPGEAVTVTFTVSEDSLGQILGPTPRYSSHAGRLRSTAQTKIATGKLLALKTRSTLQRAQSNCARSSTKNGTLCPNQFVNTRLVAHAQGVTLIATSTIQHNGQTSFVYLIQNGTAQMRTVKAGRGECRHRRAVEGIEPGDVVIETAALRSYNPTQSDDSRAKDWRHEGAASLESLTSIHPAAGRDFVAHGRDPARQASSPTRQLPFGPAAGGLSDHPGRHVLSGSKPGRRGDHGPRAAGASVRPDARAQPDDLR